MHLNKLKKMIEVSDKNLFPCINDLVVNGLSLARFSSEDRKPNRQDITQYLAAWFKYIKVSSDICRNWMNEYCVDILSAISSSSASKIRHSTKSNIKYIYTSDVTFSCEREDNPYKASCGPNCSIYGKMSKENKEKRAKELKEARDLEAKINAQIKKDEAEAKALAKAKAKEAKSKILLMRDKYEEQFNKAMEIIIDNIKKGVKKKNIITLLNDSGFKSRTGREWTSSLLTIELKKYNKNVSSN